nr:MAG TPA: hypothetical protein [Caudoviricetes sp.]
MATAKAPSGRRGPSKSAQPPCGAQNAPAITFPMNGPKAPQIKPEECVVRCIEASSDGIRVMVLPRVVDVRRMLNETYGNLGWGDTYYRSGSWWRCQIEVLSLAPGLYVRKDAGPLDIPTTSPERMQENTSFLAAAAMLGFAEDVMELPAIFLKADKVPVMQDKSGKYRPAAKLTVDRFARDEAGAITMVQFALSDGKKVLWPEKA